MIQKILEKIKSLFLLLLSISITFSLVSCSNGKQKNGTTVEQGNSSYAFANNHAG